MNFTDGLKKIVGAVKGLVVEPEPQLPEWMQPDARTPRWADDDKRTRENIGGGVVSSGASSGAAGAVPTKKSRIPVGYQDSTGFHHGAVPASKAHNSDIE